MPFYPLVCGEIPTLYTTEDAAWAAVFGCPERYTGQPSDEGRVYSQ